ncbi:MAG: hypothetical protein AMXMBFR33_05700 [Candidatus Xenobia bacterium]
MAHRLYLDHNVKGSIVRGLRIRGLDVLTAEEDQAAQLVDPVVLRRATELERVLFTEDKDFLSLAYEALETGHYDVVYASQNSPVGPVIEDLELIARASEPGDLRNQLLRVPFGTQS